MKRSSARMVLIAKGREDQAPRLEAPFEIWWNDGAVATLADFQKHAIDTYGIDYKPDGIEMRMFPHVCAKVRFHAFAGSWVMYDVGSQPISLALPDSATSDHEIEAQLSTPRTVYRATICHDTPVCR